MILPEAQEEFLSELLDYAGSDRILIETFRSVDSNTPLEKLLDFDYFMNKIDQVKENYIQSVNPS